MKLVVIDASVILKWVLPRGSEPYQDQAQVLATLLKAGSIRVGVPSLWYFEVGNLLARKYPLQADQQLANLRLILEPCEVSDKSGWQNKALALVQQHGVTFYDAVYHALAIIEQGIFLTADEKYLQMIGKEPHAMHFKDWPLT
ncbi:MAG: type II toxin-antitoxin system VapC family toxin [Gammaproteobacteria bacterium]